MPVLQVAGDEVVSPNHVYVIPPNADLSLEGEQLKVSLRSKVGVRHLTIDGFFRSLAAAYGGRAIGVILSGTGSDGTHGLEEIKAAGGITIAQSVDSADQGGMPSAAIATGIVDFVLAPHEIAAKLAEFGKHDFFVKRAHDQATEPSADATGAYRKILALVRSATGSDFGQYKETTIRRRILRRAAIHSKETLIDYLGYLEEQHEEIDALRRDLVINVTSFFRDPESFDALKASIFPRLAVNRPPNDPVRIWVAGCSTGQEAYSLAILLVEFFEDDPGRPAIQIFATDVSENLVIDQARAGIYPESIAAELSPERLRRFFIKEERGYRINKSIRELCVFARQNLITDPPLSRMDLISCRNVLIYLDKPLQERLASVFHYALKPEGYLMLGHSEIVPASSEFFERVDKKHCIYSKKPVAIASSHTPFDVGHHRPFPTITAEGNILRAPTAVEFQKKADRLVVERFAPTSVLVNDKLDILQFRGDTGRYLRLPRGQASFNLLKMARAGLSEELGVALRDAQKSKAVVRREGVRMREASGRSAGSIDLEVTPITLPGTPESCFLVLFQEASVGPSAAPPVVHSEVDELGSASRDEELSQLRRELAAAREYLQSVTEQYEAANDDLKSMNEEMLSSNEELQSTNEELQSSKEELQSSNEELTTLADELRTRNAELSLLDDDLGNVLTGVKMPLVIVGRDLRVRRFNSEAAKTLKLGASDTGRLITNLAFFSTMPDVENLLSVVMEDVVAQEREVQDRSGRWLGLRIQPYRTSDNRINGAIVALIDIDEAKRAQELLRSSEVRYRRLFEAARDGILLVDPVTRKITESNPYMTSLLLYSPEELRGKELWEIGLLKDEEASQAAFQELQDHGFIRYEDLPLVTKDGKRRDVEFVSNLYTENAHQVIQCNIRDISDRKRIEHELLESVKRERAARAEGDRLNRVKDDFLATLSHELRTPLNAILGWAQILLQRHGAAMPTEWEQGLRVIERSARDQAQLIADLLDMSRMQAGRLCLEVEAVELRGPVEAALQTVHPAAEAKGVRVEKVLKSGKVSGDPTRLQQIVWNLLANAVKFTPKGGVITVNLMRAGSHMELVVADTGKGIAADFLPHMFERFRQADASTSRQTPGLGLGLAIVKELVELHGGTVRATSEGEGRGATFVARIPALASGAVDAQERESGEAPAGRSPKVASGMASSLSRVKVLVVEDEPEARDVLQAMLEDCGALVKVVGSADEGLEEVERFRPDVLVSDIGMPGCDGYELVRRVRALGVERGGEVPALALTAYARPEDQTTALQAGFNAHVAKPIDAEEVLTTVRKLTRCAREQETGVAEQWRQK